MFIDEAVVEIHAGDGGRGCFSYLREKFRPKGKPDGGNGGRGGSVFFRASQRVETLQDLSIRHILRGNRGDHGGSKNKHGKDGEDIYIDVPVGLTVRTYDTDEIIHDFTEVGETFCVAAGGRGGRGNAALVSRNNPDPDHAQYGMPGEQLKMKLVLKVMANVGLVGKPNAGKSTFLSSVSKAHPKIADYPFTTLQPQLGVVRLPRRHQSFTIADIPGIIDGAHLGKGLGIQFLKHIERTQVLAILVDGQSENPLAEAEKIVEELRQYSSLLLEKPRVFILTKGDISADTVVPEGWFSMSSVTGQGVTEVLHHLFTLVAQIKGSQREPVEVG
ncbi:Obg family GTPase CgtA [Chitinivibrio alkaliphilus]|uniref:GTPase Obg n=1 Tax=Chitinivibrio alkaliphilus ACht1 TaxID=1313304 RepID=U7D5L6_9BACT|nr:GTPase ObgE [Chitinivibrio alkaliphilus]ERP31263.1 GTPase ObgE [Chitinivibrio alkaliphilus ACht1]